MGLWLLCGVASLLAGSGGWSGGAEVVASGVSAPPSEGRGTTTSARLGRLSSTRPGAGGGQGERWDGVGDMVLCWFGLP